MGGAVSGVSGASPIWNMIIREALDKAEKGAYDPEEDGHAWPRQPEGVEGKNVCATSGLVAPGPEDNPGCPIRFEYFLRGTSPQGIDGARQDIPIDKTTGQMAGSDTPPENIEVQNHPVYEDPLKTLFCLDCPPPTTPVNIRYPLR